MNFKNVALGNKSLSRIYHGNQIVFPQPIRDELILWYDFRGRSNKDAAKGVAQDLSGRGNNGALTNFAYIAGSGYEIEGLRFDGIDDRINAGNKSDFDITDALSIELYIKPNPTGSIGGFVKGTSGAWLANSFGLRNRELVAKQLDFFISDGNTLTQISTNNLPTDKWSHIVAVTSKQLGEVRIYLNGALINKASRGIADIRVGTGGLELGTAFEGRYADAYIKMARLYKKALTAQEVKFNYELEKLR